MQKEKIHKTLIILLFVQLFFVFLFSKFPDFIEKFYSNGIYLYTSSFFRTVFGWLPFSFGDLIYATLIILLIRFLVLFFKSNRKRKKLLFLELLASFSIFYFLFYFSWGLNYSRTPLTSSMQLETTTVSKEKLLALTDKLLEKTKKLQVEITNNDTIAVVVPYSKNEILEKTPKGYHLLSKQFEQFTYYPTSLKKSLFSVPLTYMGFAGYLNPITGEAQVDYLLPKISLLSTSSHEIAHQLGIASESEANFIGFLAATHQEDVYFNYAAYLNAFRYALFDVYRLDKELYQTYLDKIPLGIVKNIRETEIFWQKYENPLEPVFKTFYDKYLKINQQEDGLRSYNKMVDLLIAYDQKYPL
jgi:hypothetical protein